MPTAVPNRDDWFEENAQFPRPIWRNVDGWMRAFIGKSELNEAWQQFTRHWLGRLCERLGGEYAVEESESFHLLSELPQSAQQQTLSFLEASCQRISKVLGDVAAIERCGKHVVLRFTDEDDYYLYISHFYPDGEFAGSGGIFLRDGYYHIALPPSWQEADIRRAVVHELTHNLLVDLPLPAWLNEIDLSDLVACFLGPGDWHPELRSTEIRGEND